MQEQILKDAFPSYNGGREVKLKDDSDGRDKLAEAFQSETNKPVFWFIDNALHKEDLEKILPEDLQRLPKRSRLLITTRILNVTDVLQERGIRRKHYPVKTLSDSHAAEVLCSDPVIRDRIEKMVKLCNGIPLVLKMVGAHLRKQNYDVERCTWIIGALQSGGNIKEDNLSNRLFHFVYNNQLEESTEEAFLDICCFFAKGFPRRVAEYIVGAEEVASLQEVTPITSSRIMDSNSWGKIEKNELPASLRSLKVAWQPAVMQDFMPNSSLEESDVISSLEELDITSDIDRVRDNTESSAFYSHLGGLNKLKALRVSRCLSLCELTEDVCGLLELNRLFLTWCTGLKELPESFGQLKALTHLDLSWCTGLKELPESFGQLKALTHLDLKGCRGLEELPCTFGGLEALQSLILHGCERLKKLPSEFQQLRSLTYLDVSRCGHLESDICVKDESIKIVEKSEHSCTNCWHNQKLRSYRLPGMGSKDRR